MVDATRLTYADVDAIAPAHSRTSCSDDNPNGNQYANEFGVPRCARCALRAVVDNLGLSPYGEPVEISVEVSVSYRNPERYTAQPEPSFEASMERLEETLRDLDELQEQSAARRAARSR